MDSGLDMQCFGGMYFIPIQIASCRQVEVFKLSLYPFNPRTINNETCPVCLDYLNEALLMRLPCLHAYHNTCITPWLYFGSLCCPLYKTGFRDSPLLSYRLGLVMQNWSTYAHAIIVHLLKLGSLKIKAALRLLSKFRIQSMHPKCPFSGRLLVPTIGK